MSLVAKSRKIMITRKTLLTFALVLVGMTAYGQDLLVRAAAVDKKMAAVDSISLRRLVPEFGREKSSVVNVSDAPASDIYPAWSNKRGRTFDVKKPDEYSIDLRHFCMPCDSRVVTSHFGYRPQFGRNHYGTDIKLYVGDTVRAAFSGKIRTVAYEAAGYGNYVIIRHENGLETVYGHMSKHLCKENQIVRAGEPIGLGGNTGRSFGSHLHFETRFLGEYIDPEKLFNFQAHDAKGDFYVYRSNGKSSLMGNPHHADPAPVLASNTRTSTPKRETPVVAVREKSETMRITPPELTDTNTDREVAKLEREKKAAEKKEAEKAKKDAAKAKKEKEKTAAKKTHSVKQGDTLYSIAKKNNTTVDKLCKINHISADATLRVGQVLRTS